MALLPDAAAAPATYSPCPCVSTVVPPMTLVPATTCPLRSGWAASIPESTTAMITSDDPVVMSHALVAWVSPCPHCPPDSTPVPVHGKYGSFGTVSTWYAAPSRSAHRTFGL